MDWTVILTLIRMALGKKWQKSKNLDPFLNLNMQVFETTERVNPFQGT